VAPVCRKIWLNGEGGNEKLTSLTIGNFDGVHLGHRELIRICRDGGVDPHGIGLLSFFPHPRQILNPNKEDYLRLFDLADQQTQLQSLGVGHLYLAKFTDEFSQMGARHFLENYLWPQVQFRKLRERCTLAVL
jgi:riboflavin kinase / FMN adenylyltransferase